MGETAELAEFVASTAFEDIPNNVVDHAKTAIRDYIGVALYGSNHGVGRQIIEYIDSAVGDGPATVFQQGSFALPGAALANGVFGHAIDYDDTFESIVIHPTSPIFAAALAAAEEGSNTTEELLTGYVVGCEAAYRVGHSTYPEHYRNGWHSTGTAGSFGATAAAASVLDCTSEEVTRAFGIVASSSSSLKKNFGSMTKPLHAGHAAQMGVRSVLLARNGFSSDPEILEGDIGYNQVMTVDNAYDPTEITDGLGDEWAVLDIGFKPYPSGVITHAAMDAMRSLVTEHSLTPEAVDQVHVTLEEAASEMLIHAHPDDALQAKFSIEFCLGAILREGDAGVNEFTDEYVTAEATRDVISLVDKTFEEDLFGGDFAGYGAIVSVTTTDGNTYREEIHFAPGSPNNPVSEERLQNKFNKCVQSTLSRSEAATLESTIANLENASLTEFVEQLQ